MNADAQESKENIFLFQFFFFFFLLKFETFTQMVSIVLRNEFLLHIFIEFSSFAIHLLHAAVVSAMCNRKIDGGETITTKHPRVRARARGEWTIVCGGGEQVVYLPINKLKRMCDSLTH